MPDHSRSIRLRAAALAVGVAVGLALALSWCDVLPGAWTLRGWVLGAEGRDEWLLERERSARLAGFAAETPGLTAGRIVFLGSSTIECYPLERSFPRAPVLNRGLVGDTARSLRARLDASLPAAPAAIVLQVGANDLRRERLEPEQVRDDVAGLLDELARRAPGAEVLVLGLFPVRDEAPAERARLQRTNALLAELARARGADFVATDRVPLVNQDGTLVPELAADPHHLGPGGYEVLTRWILQEGGAVARLLDL